MPVTIKGSGGGSVTLDAGAAVADTTLTLPNVSGTVLAPASGVLPVASGGTGLAALGPAFSSYQTGTAQVFPSSGWTKITLNAEEFDTNSNFDSTTNYRFTPTVAGYYQVDATLAFAGSAALLVGLFKNGAVYKTGNYISNSAGIAGTLSALVYMNGSTDYIELYGNSNVTATVATGLASTSMQGFLARSA